MSNKLKTVSLEVLPDKYIGKKGSAKREAFDCALNLTLSEEAMSRAGKQQAAEKDDPDTGKDHGR